MSTAVPSARYGISATGIMREITPLFPCRPASLSPIVTLRICATLMVTVLSTPGSNSSPSSRSKIETSMTVPLSPLLMRKLVSLTSRAFSPNMARSSLSSAVSSVSPLGAILPTKMSLPVTSAPTTTIPSSPRLRRSCSLTFGMSRVSSSAPNLVSIMSAVYSLIWIEVRTSSLTSLSETIIASS